MKKLPLIVGVLGALAPLSSIADILAVQTFAKDLENNRGKVVRYDELTGTQVPGWTFDPLSVNLSVDQMAGLTAFGGVGYVSSRNTGQILHFDLHTGVAIGNGVFADVPIEPDDPRLTEDPNATANPAALRVGPDGLLYVADSTGSSVLRYNLQTGALVDRVVDGLFTVGAIGFDSAGTQITTTNTFFGPNTIFTGPGTPPNELTSSQSNNLLAPNSLLSNADDSFLITDLVSNAIFRFTADGTSQGPFAIIEYPSDVDSMNPPMGATLPSNFPSDLRFDAEGNLLVVTLGISSVAQNASKNYGSILRYAPDGTLIERLADSLFAPSAIALVDGLTGTPGDFNRDGTVNAADYDMWKEGFGRLVTPGSNADGNFDGAIDAADYTVWRDNLPAGLATGGVGVPEPAAGVMALAVLLLSVGYHSRRRC